MADKSQKSVKNNQHQDVRVKIDVDTAPVSVPPAPAEKGSKDSALLVEIVKGVTAILAALITVLGTLYASGAFAPKPTATPTPTFTAAPSLTFTAFPTLPPTSTNTPLPPPTDTPTLTLEPTLAATFTPTFTPTIEISLTPDVTCPWTPFLNGSSVSPLGNASCLNDLMSYGIFGDDEKQVSFSLNRGRTTGTFGVCMDVSRQKEAKFHVTLSNDMTSVRFLAAIAPDPVPNKSSYSIIILPGEDDKLYVKRVNYLASGYAEEKGTIPASLDWKGLQNWNFDFTFTFTGPKVKAIINKTPFSDGQLTSATRYLCFAYQAIPTSERSAHFDITVTLP